MIKFIDNKSIITIYLIDTNYEILIQAKNLRRKNKKITECCKL